MADLVSRLVFQAEDQATPGIQAVADALAGLSGGAASSAERLTKSLGDIQDAMKALDKDDFGKALRGALEQNQYAVDAFEQQITQAFSRIEAQAKLRSAGVEAALRGMGVRSLATIREEIKGLGQSYTFAKEGGASPGELSVARENVAARARALAQEYSNVRAGISDTGKAAQEAEGGILSLSGAMGGLTRVGLAVGGLFAAGSLVKGISDAAKEAVILAARFETLGVVMQTVGKNTGHMGSEMDAVAATLQRQGISMLESRQQTVSLAAANMDLSKATELARLAQDAAVISGDNSSQAFARLVAAIQTGQPEMLRTLGIYVSFDEAYKRMAQAMGVNAENLTEQEKMQARLNAVLDYAPRLMGTYEAAMGTAGKQLSSFKRYVEDLLVALGTPVQPTFADAVKQAGDSIKGFTEEVKSPAVQQGIADLGKQLGWLADKFLDLAAAPSKFSYRLVRDLRARQITENDRSVDFTAYWARGTDEATKEKMVLEYNARKIKEATDRKKSGDDVTYGTVVQDGELAAVAEAQLKQLREEVFGPVDRTLREKRTSLPREEQLDIATREWTALRGQAERAESIAQARGDLEGVRKAELAVMAADKDLIDSRKKINDAFDKGGDAAAKFEDKASKLVQGLRDQNAQLEAQLSGDNLASALKKNEAEFKKSLRDIESEMKFAKGSIEDLAKAKEELDRRFQLKNQLTQRDYYVKGVAEDAQHAQTMAELGQGDPYQARIQAAWAQAVRERVAAGADEQRNLEAQQRMEARILAVQRDQVKARMEARAELSRLTGNAREALDAEIKILEVQKEQAKTGEERALIEEKIARLAAKRNLDVGKLVQFGLNDAGVKAFDDLADKIGNALPQAFDILADTGVSAFSSIASGGFNAQQALAGLTSQVIRLAAELAVAAVKMQILGAFSRDTASVDLSSVGTGEGGEGGGGKGFGVSDASKYARYGKDAYDLFGGSSSLAPGVLNSEGAAMYNSLQSSSAAYAAEMGMEVAPQTAAGNWAMAESMQGGAASSTSSMMSVAGPALGAASIGYGAGNLMRPDLPGVGIGAAAIGGTTAAALSSSTVMGAAGLTALGGLSATGVGAIVAIAAAAVMALATPETKKSTWSVPKGSQPAVLLWDGETTPAAYGVIKTTSSGMFGSTSTKHTTIYDLPTPAISAEVKAGMDQASASLTAFSRQLGYTSQGLKDALKGLSFPAIPVPEGYEAETYRNLANFKTEAFLSNTGLKGEADAYLRSGEAYIDEMGRMAAATSAFEQIAAATGATLDSITRGMSKFASADLGSRLIEGAGGVDVLAAALARLNAYGYSQSEQVTRLLTANAENAGRAIAMLEDSSVNIENFWVRFRQEWERGMDPAKMPAWAAASQRMEAWENVKSQARQMETQAHVQAAQKTIQALEAQKSAAEQLKKAWGDVAARMGKLSESIRWDKNVSPLSGPERQAELMAKLVKLRDAARSGDATDLGDVDTTVGDLLSVAKENLGATEQYFAVYNETQSIIGEIRSIATREAATADAQVQQLAMQIAQGQAQIDALNNVNRGIGEVVSAVNNVSAAIGGAIQAANAAQAQASVTPAMVAAGMPSALPSFVMPEGGDGTGSDALLALSGGSPRDERDAALSGALGAFPDMQGGRPKDERDAALSGALGALPNIPAFAGGGDHAGGLRIVGEQGWEMEATGPARYYTHQQTREMVASRVDLGPMLVVMSTMADTMDLMRRETIAGNAVIAEKLSGVRQGLRNVEERIQ